MRVAKSRMNRKSWEGSHFFVFNLCCISNNKAIKRPVFVIRRGPFLIPAFQSRKVTVDMSHRSDLTNSSVIFEAVHCKL